MFMLIGLGNPGSAYALTRHNIGFMFIDYLADKNGLSLKRSKWKAQMVKTFLWDAPLLMVKPETYMNLSGSAVALIANFYSIERKKIIVVHDDLDLDFGRIKIVFNRGAGGHNGVQSIISHLGGKEFVRIRVGINRPQQEMAASSYVLSRFRQAELNTLPALMEALENATRLIVEQGVSEAMNKIHSDNHI